MERNLKKIIPYKPNKNWYAVQFEFNNPTITPYTLDLFNGYTLSNIQTSQSPISNPSVVTYTSPVGLSPFYSAISSVNNNVYVTNAGSSSVSIISAVTGLIVGTISISGVPSGITYNSNSDSMYVADANGSIYIISCGNNTVTSVISLSFSPSSIVYNSQDDIIYISNSAINNIYVFDCGVNSIIGSPIFIGGGTSPSLMGYNSYNNTLYICNTSSNDISVINCNTNTLSVPSISVGANPSGISYCPINNSMYVCNVNSNDVYVIDCDTNSVVSSPILIGLNPQGIAYNSITNTIYVSCISSNEVYIINCYTNLLIGSPINTGIKTNPYGVSYNQNNNSIYICNSSTNDVTILSPLVPQVPYVSGSTSYNEFLRELQNTPKRVGHISLLVDNISQQYVPYEILKRDANGNQETYVKLPNTYTSVNQSQISVCYLSFGEKELVLDNTTILSRYTILPTTSVKMVIYYDEIDKSDMLSEIIDYAKIADVKVPDGNSRTEEEIELKDFRPLTKPEWLKNFKVAKKITI